MKMDELISGLPVRCVHDGAGAGGAGAVRVCDLTEDSRTVVPGSLFVARRGTKDDGRRFVEAAVDAGAVAVLTDDEGLRLPGRSRAALLHAADVALVSAHIAERFYGNPSSKLTLIGVTGTNGKTTTTWLIHRMLNAARVRCGLIGTVVVDDGVETAPAVWTTPPAIELSRTLAMMVDAGCKAAVMEVSSHALDQRRVAALAFDIGVFTNLTGDHLDYHGTVESYARAKAMLFERLPAGGDGLAIVNADDASADRMLDGCPARVLRCSVEGGEGRAGLPGPAWCRGRALAESMGGTSMRLAGPWGEFEERAPLVGRYNLMNALQAVAACHGAGLSPGQIRRALAGATAPPGRLEPVTGPRDPFAVFVDYAHTDDALAKVLSTVRPLVGGGGGGGRLWVIFGCGGDRDRTKRPRMGRAGAELADLVVVTSDNPRTERPSAIVDEILGGVPTEVRGKVVVQIEREEAIAYAIERAEPGDLIIIAGKGHETEQIMPDGHGGTVRRHFDDREVARAALRSLAERDAAIDAPMTSTPHAAGPSVIGSAIATSRRSITPIDRP